MTVCTAPEHIVRAGAGERLVCERRIVQRADGRFGETILRRVREHVAVLLELIYYQKTEVRPGLAERFYRIDQAGIEAREKLDSVGKQGAVRAEIRSPYRRAQLTLKKNNSGSFGVEPVHRIGVIRDARLNETVPRNFIGKGVYHNLNRITCPLVPQTV